MDDPRTIKIEMALSPDTDVFIVFNGKKPDALCFRQLRRTIDVLEESMSVERISGKDKPLKPCAKHPDAERTDGLRRRCVECLKNAARNMNAKRFKRESA